MQSRHLAMILLFPSSMFLMNSHAQGSTIWSSGPNDITFVHAVNSADADAIAPSVSITRNGAQGIFNAVSESFFSHGTSPAGTKWAFSGLDLSPTFAYGAGASNFANLTFDSWDNVLGGGGQLQSNIFQRPAVLHILAEDIYIDIEFTSWGGGGSGGGFTYIRAVAPPGPTPGDANGDGVINIDDYLAIDHGYLNGLTGFSNGDFNNDGTINGADYAIINGNGPHVAAFAASPVPEPASLLALSFLGVTIPLRRGKCRR